MLTRGLAKQLVKVVPWLYFCATLGILSLIVLPHFHCPHSIHSFETTLSTFNSISLVNLLVVDCSRRPESRQFWLTVLTLASCQPYQTTQLQCPRFKVISAILSEILQQFSSSTFKNQPCMEGVSNLGTFLRHVSTFGSCDAWP